MLEEKIEALTKAVLALAQVMANPRVVIDPAPAVDVPPEEPKKAKPKAEKPKAEEPKADDAKVFKEALNTTVDYDTMAKAFKEYITAKGRDEAIKLLETFGAKTLKDVPEAKWGMMMKAIS